MKNRAKWNNTSGFTLLEMMVTVVVIVVLFALAMIPISKMQKDIRQTELDSRAEMIFTAVQNRMTRLQAAGQSDVYQIGKAGVQELTIDPADAEETEEARTLVYVTSGDKADPNSAAAWLYPETEAEAELWNGSWVVEYDAKGGSVYAVFYSRESMNYTEDTKGEFNDLRVRRNRVSAGAKIGYYGGDSVGAAETNNLTLTLEVINREKLQIVAACKRPAGVTGLKFYATVADESGNIAKDIEIGYYGGDSLVNVGRNYTATLTLDDLSEGKDLRFCEQKRFEDLVPGENLTVKIRVQAVKNIWIEDAIETVSVNSLFAEVEANGDDGRRAIIRYGRHLQNLELNASGLSKEQDENKIVTAAVQKQKIQFQGTEHDNWSELYPNRSFTPIENPNLKSYDSTDEENHPEICDLPIETAQDAGLFKTFGGKDFVGELKNIRLVDAKITGKETVGGLVGKLNGTTTIDGCQVYLKNVKDKNIPKEQIFAKHTRIGGTVAGGLVGSTEGNTLTIQNSLAATVIRGVDYAGGLIGNISDGIIQVAVQNSYADCYLSSDGTDGKTGGLIGASGPSAGVATKPINLRNCYAAGFLEGGITAGFSTGSLYTVEYCYSACAPLTKKALSYGTASNNDTHGTTITNVYYLSETDHPSTNIGERMSYEKLSGQNAATLLSDAFTKQNGDTYAYNLMNGLGLNQYSYPKLKDLPHYGDWQAAFEDSALVYYEWYGEKSYGFFGANVSTLSDKPVVGDGYGIIYGIEQKENVKVTVDGKTYELEPKNKITIQVTDKGETKTYYLLPLPPELVQEVAEVPQNFYMKLTVESGDYYYNPHFACTAVADGSKVPAQIRIRTARQLYALSEYYDAYAKLLPADADFKQECDIDYAAYEWAQYGKKGTVVKEQKPIGQAEKAPFGQAEKAPFQHSYDGEKHTITGVSFASETNGAAVGLFGFVTGTLENIVVTTEKALADAPTSKLGGRVQWRTVYIGVLAGKNSGRIYNCAVSGYKLSCYAYSGSTCYIGGLVGCNEGTVSACSADIPAISGNTTNARGYYAGGLAGVNEGGGYIRQSYALGSIELREIRGSAVISGFVGDNQGTIRNSYCATALSAVTGAEVNGFASAHGSVFDCYYLSGGTYTFAGTVRLYDYKPGDYDAKAKTHEQLKELLFSGFGKVTDAANSVNHRNTDASEEVYPYPGIVSGQGGIVHYGDWPTQADMGTVGMIYWEYEEGGANSGYHFSYIGFDAKGFRKEGSSLCTAHDDGGRITAYGYGYYEKEKTGKVSLTDTIVKNGTFQPGDENTDVEDALANQVTGYTFTCYQTGEEGLRLESSTDANGTWTLTQNGQEYTYAVCPFFGDSFCTAGAGQDVADAEDLGKAGTGKKYQIRSVEQLQFINWSYSNGKGSVRTNVTDKTYTTFPYLQYKTTNSNQSRIDAQNVRPQRSWTQTHDVNGVNRNNPTDGAKNTLFYPIAGAVGVNTTSYSVTLYAWFGGKYDGGNYYIKNIAIDSYCYNVGVFGTTAGADIRNIVLYSDNGGVIQRSSNVTGSDTGTKESRYQCAYALGGLAGIAYEYANEIGANGAVIQNCAIAGYKIQDNSKNQLGLGEAVVGGLLGVSRLKLDQCSAVVDIQINCTHRNTNNALIAAWWGNYVRVGGLVGGVRGKVSNCYTGGSITVSDETLEERVLADDKTNTIFAPWKKEENKTSKLVKMTKGGDSSGPDTYVYLGGIGGSGFSSTFVNFGATVDGNPEFENCYTYMTFPAMQGTITGISLIGSVADRYGLGGTMTITNCYYLDSSAKIDFRNLPKYYGKWNENYSLSKILSTDEARQKMLKGDLSYLKNYVWDGAKRTYRINGLTPLTYEQMSNQIGGEGFIKAQNGSAEEYTTFRLALNKNKEDGAFGWVTNAENGSTIHGKYSFPGGDTALQGQDYPFPTVLTQTDSLGKPVSLHYGAWPKVGMFWSKGIVSVDLIADYDTNANRSAIELELNLTNVSNKDDLTGVPKFTYTDEGVVEASAVQITEGVRKGDFTVTLTGVEIGATEVIAEYNGYTARLMVAVTAELKVVMDPASVKLTLKPAPVVTPPPSGEGGETTPEPAPPAYLPSDEFEVKFAIKDKNGNPITADPSALRLDIKDSEFVTWEFNSGESVKIENGAFKLRGVREGKTDLEISVTYKLNDRDYTAKTHLPVTILPPPTPPETGGSTGASDTG